MANGERRQGLRALRDMYLCADPLSFGLGRGEAMALRLGELVDGLIRRPVPDAERVITGVTCDSRQVRPGHLFVAVRGSHDDGSTYIADAVRRGAAAIVTWRRPSDRPPVPTVVVRNPRALLAEAAARFHGAPTEKLNVVGITGTKGKSTTAYLVRSILAQGGRRVGLLGTIEYSLGGRTLPSPMTTPPPELLQAYFAEMVQNGCRAAVMEVSSHALAQERTRGIRFAAGIFTNLTRDHLDYHGTPAKYRAAKARLVEQLPAKGLAILNADDAAADHMASRSAGRVVTYALERPDADVRGILESSDLTGLRLRVLAGAEEIPVGSRLVGRHNAYNLLAAAATAWTMGWDPDAIRRGLEAMTAVPGRLEPVDAGQDFRVFVDYAHTEDSLRSVLACLRASARETGGRLLLVFGCGGDRDRGKRPRMGAVAEALSDFFILTSDNPRSEDPGAILREIEAGIRNHSTHVVEPERREAIRIAVGMARPGDVVLIAGKGHETYQVLGTVTRPFDDRQVAREFLAGRANGATA